MVVTGLGSACQIALVAWCLWNLSICGARMLGLGIFTCRKKSGGDRTGALVGLVNLFQRRVLVGEDLFGEITKERDAGEEQTQDAGEQQRLSQLRRTDEVALVGVLIGLGNEARHAVIDKVVPDGRLQRLHVLAETVGLTEIEALEA